MDKILNDKLTLDSIDLKSSLRQHFGFDKFKGSQEEIINNLLKGSQRCVGNSLYAAVSKGNNKNAKDTL